MDDTRVLHIDKQHLISLPSDIMEESLPDDTPRTRLLNTTRSVAFLTYSMATAFPETNLHHHESFAPIMSDEVLTLDCPKIMDRLHCSKALVDHFENYEGYRNRLMNMCKAS